MLPTVCAPSTITNKINASLKRNHKVNWYRFYASSSAELSQNSDLYIDHWPAPVCCSNLQCYLHLPACLIKKNAGQLCLGSSRPESSRPESSRPDNISAWSYFAYFFIRDASMNCVLYIKCSAKV